jgi:peptidyl-prolyl cis-trans isomerase-like 3
MSVTLHTSAGNLKVELACEECPKLCENFLALAAAGTYDGTKFHRNIAGFLIQGGDHTGTGKGGECIHGGKMQDEFHPSLKHAARGVLAMASNGPNTIGSQFYLTYAAQPTLDGVYCPIGRAIGEESFRTLDAMEKVEVGAKHRPLKDIIIGAVTIHANPFALAELQRIR